MAIGDLISGVSGVVDALNGSLGQTESFADGFTVPATFSADGTGLPYSKVPSYQPAQLRRNIISWFVPEFGLVRMYVNPASISYNHKKLITRERTKGGYTLQYWGEELDTLTIGGTTGSAGIEGINMLYEIYRAEQYAFDATGLTLAANNSATSLASTFADIGGAVAGDLGGSIGGAIGGLLGGESPNANLASQNITSLAQLAFSVEMFYNGWVYRGFFENMTVNERADNFLIDYQMTFAATQRRGYRTNYFAWAKNAASGPSQYTSPPSFSGSVSPGF